MVTTVSSIFATFFGWMPVSLRLGIAAFVALLVLLGLVKVWIFVKDCIPFF